MNFVKYLFLSVLLLTAAENFGLPASREVFCWEAPKGSKNWYWHGLVLKHDGVVNLRDLYALRLDVRSNAKTAQKGTMILHLAPGQGRKDLHETTRADFAVSVSDEWQTIELPLTGFDVARGDRRSLQFIARITVEGGEFEVRNLRFIDAPTVKLSADIASKAAENAVARYEFSVKNTSEKKQIFRLVVERRGWEGMPTALSRDVLELAPGASEKVTLSVEVPAHLPGGAHERQLVRALPQNPGEIPAELEFITVQRVASPFLLRDRSGWQEVADNIQKYEWAKKAFAENRKLADEWVVPTKPGVMSDQGTLGVVRTRYEGKMRACTILWNLTKEDKYFQKLRDFLLMFSNPADGYPVLLHGTSQGIPQEGGTFEQLSLAYDSIREKLSPAERQQIEHTMRLYIDTVLERMGDSGISNWAIFNQVPAAGCALILHDMVRFHALLYRPTGLIDQFVHGTMNDGWWFEMSITYNLHCAEGFTKLGLMARAFGLDLLHMQFPVSLTNLSGRRPYELSNYLGMAFTKAGPLAKNSIGIKAMWDGVLPYPDYRGIMVGMGDGHEMSVGGAVFELAYFAYRDPRYASIIKNNPERDLVYGIGALPEETPVLFTQSAHSDNAGIAILRSQAQRSNPREQIQLGFKYGTHGGYHGHFDRLSLLSLMRYGRGFWNPESVWYGYPSYLYKWWVQTSLPHNMVVVDALMQEPTECRPLLFHSGKHLQAIAADGVARWSNPPYLGGYEKIKEIREGTERYVPIPDNPPRIGELGAYTEPVFSRRLQLVTDDYVVIADYLAAEKEHTFDQLLHLRGAKPISGLKKSGHRPQFDSSPLSTGQFVVNIDEYEMSAPARITSRHHFNAKERNGRNKRNGKAFELTDDFYHEPGELFIDVHQLWPLKAQYLTGDYPENQLIDKRLNYEVKGDGRILASGCLRSWILGKASIDVDVTGLRELTLATRKDFAKRTVAHTLFWADARILTEDGKTIRLSDLKPTVKGVCKLPLPGVDYYGGPVRLQGGAYSDTIGAEPEKEKQPGELIYDLTDLKAVRFFAVLGGDFPVGDEEQLRKLTSVRSFGKEAEFLTVLEPREGAARVKSARAVDRNTIEVILSDGTVEVLKIKNFYHRDTKPTVELYRNGTLVDRAG